MQKNKDINEWDKIRREDRRFTTPKEVEGEKSYQHKDYEERDLEFTGESEPKDLRREEKVKYDNFRNHRKNYPDAVVEREYKRPLRKKDTNGSVNQ